MKVRSGERPPDRGCSQGDQVLAVALDPVQPRLPDLVVRAALDHVRVRHNAGVRGGDGGGAAMRILHHDLVSQSQVLHFVMLAKLDGKKIKSLRVTLGGLKG